MKKCPCGSQLESSACCLAIIDGKKQATTAEQLMRSRYTAFTLSKGKYLIDTHHSSTRRNVNRAEIETWARSVQWIGLTVICKDQGAAEDVEGYVEFKAHFSDNGVLEQIHENSLFKKENGRWKYVSGKHF